MIKCKACNNDMDMVEVDGYPGQYETVCDSCRKAADDACRMGDWDFEGLYWSKHEKWPGVDGRMK
jgi:hypothetical protein